MKKIISIILAIVMLLSVSLSSMSAYAKEVYEQVALNTFIDGIVELSQEFDAEKEFVIDEPIKENNVEQFYSNGEETETPSDTEYDLVDFQTARLIVRADDKFDTYGAIKCISGFLNFYILQYDTPKDAQIAYNEYSNNKDILSVAPDLVINPLRGEKSNSTENTKANEYLCDWSHDRTQSDRLLDYIEENNIHLDEIIVGVVDLGVDYNHEFLSNRIERSYFNSSTSGTANDEMEIQNPEECHGTAVCSVIVDNTPQEVKVKAYRVIDDDGNVASISQISAGILKAIQDEVDVINISLALYGDIGNLIEESLLLAYQKNIPVVTAVGNDASYATSDKATLPENICVSATNFDNTVCDFNNFSPTIDVAAPGQDINVATYGDTYSIWMGTSFSAPNVSALVAIMKGINDSLTVDEVTEKLVSSSVEVFLSNGYSYSRRGNQMVQYGNAIDLPKLTAPKIELSSGIYDGIQTCNIICDDKNATILYTTDGTYPTIENGVKFTEPFEITKYTEINAVAYYSDNDYYSEEVTEKIRIRYLGNESDFTIDENGVITNYNGTVEDLLIPEYIDGIQVKDIGTNSFNNDTTMAITLPNSVTSISSGAKFEDNNTLRFISGEGVISVGDSVFAYMDALETVDFPNMEELGIMAFRETTSLTILSFPKLTKIENSTFYYGNVNEIYAPNVTTVSYKAFINCSGLNKVYLPKLNNFDGILGSSFEGTGFSSATMPEIVKATARLFYNSRLEIADFPNVESIKSTSFQQCFYLKYINLPRVTILPSNAFVTNNYQYNKEYYLNNVETVEENAFGSSPAFRVEFSHLVSTADLPNIKLFGETIVPCRIALPSTFKECTEDTKGRNYIIYGTEGTYAEEWAIANGHEFIEISQETALLEDVPTEYYGLGEVLSPDVIGFNKTYQWYSNSTPDNINGKLIEGATDKEFNPADYPQAKYYYCVVTSTDVGYEPIEIRTGVTENTTISTATILSPETSQIRFGTNSDGSYNNSFDVRTRAVITDEDFKAYIAPTNEIAEQKISQAGFVYTKNSTEFSTELAQRSAKGEEIAGYTNAPVNYIQDADGYYMFACVITDIPVTDKSQSITAYAYICVNGYWYFFDPEMTTDFGWLYDTYYPKAVEKYGW